MQSRAPPATAPFVPVVKGQQRRSEIRRRLLAEGFAETRQLAADLEVDASTIRRDLDGLARAGLVQRTHGGARPVADPASLDLPYAAREHALLAEKRAIAAFAASLVSDGDSLVLDSGSTTFALARALEHHRNLTVATNDLRIAHHLARRGGVHLLVTGGQLMETVFTLVGPIALGSLAALRAEWSFLGADALDPATGVTNRNTVEVPLKQAMLEAGARTVLLADSTKFGHRALAVVSPVQAFDHVVTDDGLSPADGAAYGPRLVRVPCGAADARAAGPGPVTARRGPSPAGAGQDRPARRPAEVPRSTSRGYG